MLLFNMKNKLLIDLKQALSQNLKVVNDNIDLMNEITLKDHNIKKLNNEIMELKKLVLSLDKQLKESKEIKSTKSIKNSSNNISIYC